MRKIAQIADLGHIITSTKTLEVTHRLEDGQSEISQGIVALGRGEWEIIQEQRKARQEREKDSANVQGMRDDIRNFVEKSLRIPQHQSLVVRDTGTRATTEVQEMAIGRTTSMTIPQHNTDF